MLVFFSVLCLDAKYQKSRLRVLHSFCRTFRRLKSLNSLRLHGEAPTLGIVKASFASALTKTALSNNRDFLRLLHWPNGSPPKAELLPFHSKWLKSVQCADKRRFQTAKCYVKLRRYYPLILDSVVFNHVTQ